MIRSDHYVEVVGWDGLRYHRARWHIKCREQYRQSITSPAGFTVSSCGGEPLDKDVTM